MSLRRASLALVGVGLAAACGESGSDDDSKAPGAQVTVRIVYLAPTARPPDAPAVVLTCRQTFETHMHPSWRSFAAVPLQAAGPDRWEVTLADVPPGIRHAFRINDPDRCDENPTGATTSNVFANDVLLVTGVPTPGQGDEPGLAFTVAPDGTVTP